MQNLQYIGKIMKPITRYLEHYYTNRQLNKKLSYWIQHIQLFFFDYHGNAKKRKSGCKEIKKHKHYWMQDNIFLKCKFDGNFNIINPLFASIKFWIQDIKVINPKIVLLKSR